MSMKQALFVYCLILYNLVAAVEAVGEHHYQLRRTLQNSSPFDLNGADDLAFPPSNHDNRLSIDDAVILSQPFSFQISMSILLGFFALLQLYLIGFFVVHRSKRVLEFAQPMAICLFVASSAVATCACFLFIYISNIGCLVREPIIFISLSLMGSTIAGRAWRISMLMSNPLMTMGMDKNLSRVERSRQFVLRALNSMTKCDLSMFKMRLPRPNGRSVARSIGIRVRISFAQMIRVIVLLVLPQILLQMIVMAVPSLRYLKEISYSDNHGILIGQYECQGAAAGSWPMYISVLFGALPYCVAFLLNMKPKAEVNQLPEIVDEKDQLVSSFIIFLQIAIVGGPISGMAIAPSVRTYASISIILSISLALCYHIAFAKLAFVNKNLTHVKNNTAQSHSFSIPTNVGSDAADSGNSAAYAVKMAKMYDKIGRLEETIQLVDETLDMWTKGSNSGRSGPIMNIGSNVDGREEIASGFTKHDLKSLDASELQVIIQLLYIKGNTLKKMHGPAGHAMMTKLNVDALKIFENCPAALRMKDKSMIFPVYSIVGGWLRGNAIEQDDTFSLERDLAERFCHEAQVQSFHFARALSQLSEIYGRVGLCEEAFKLFETMRMIYLPKLHPKLIQEVYWNQDKCAHTFSASALWYLQQGKIDQAIKRCDLVIRDILPNYDHKDVLGLFHILIPIIRVLKWNGHIALAKKIVEEHISPDITGECVSMRRALMLVLNICHDCPSHEYYKTNDMDSDVAVALELDFPEMVDFVYMANGWSMKSLIAELCLCLARQFNPGCAVRESLVERGIQFSIIANRRITGAARKIKHIVAFDAHNPIFLRLTEMVGENLSVSRGTVHDNKEGRPKELSTSSSERKPGAVFSLKLVVRDDSSISIGSQPNPQASAPTSVSVLTKKQDSVSQISSSHGNSLAESCNRSLLEPVLEQTFRSDKS